jgi:hypothetical protein
MQGASMFEHLIFGFVSDFVLRILGLSGLDFELQQRAHSL